MTTAIILLIVALFVFFLIGRKIYHSASNSPETSIKTRGNNSPVFHVGGDVIIGVSPRQARKATTPFTSRNDDTPAKDEPNLPLMQRSWFVLTTPADEYERAAGFRAAGAIYYTGGAFPRYFLMHASSRVYTATEEHYDNDGAMQYILLEQADAWSTPCRAWVCDDAEAQQLRLQRLYKTAKEKAAAGKKTNAPLE